MAKAIEVAQDVYNVQSGKSILIQAVVVDGGVVLDKEKLLFGTTEGDIDAKGLFKAPEANNDVTATVTIKIASTKAVKTVTVTVGGKAVAKDVPLISIAEVDSIGSEGKYTLHIQAIADNKRGYKCEVVIADKGICKRKIIPNKSDPKKYVDEETYPTDDDGFLSLPLRSFTEKRRSLFVRVKGTKKDETVKLFGPTLPSKIKTGAGFWANLLKK